MKITVCGPVESISGTYPDSDLIYYTVKRTGKIYGRGKAKPFDPKSENQRASRSINTKASRVWTSLTAAARADWEKFTKQFASQPTPRRAMDVCREAQRMRLILGLDPTTQAPQLSFPAPVTDVSVEPGANPNEFSFRIRHAVDSPAGHMVFVKITKQMVSPACTPIARQSAAICGLGPASVAALPEQGGLVSFTGARFSIEPGARFGVVMTVIRAEDGLASQPAFFDLFRA